MSSSLMIVENVQIGSRRVAVRLSHEPNGTQPSSASKATPLTAAAATRSLGTGREHELHADVGHRCARREIVARPQIDLSIRIMETNVRRTPRYPLSAAIARQYEPGALVELRMRHKLSRRQQAHDTAR